MASRVESFVEDVLEAAIAAELAYGVPRGLSVAVAAHETGWGRAVKGNNYFGIKGKGQQFTTHEVIDGRTVKIVDSFRSYASPIEAFRDFGRLMNTPRYEGVLQKSSVPEMAKAMKAAGYATDPKYASKITAVSKTAERAMNPTAPIPQARPHPARNPRARPATSLSRAEIPGMGMPSQPMSPSFASPFAASTGPDFGAISAIDAQFGQQQPAPSLSPGTAQGGPVANTEAPAQGPFSFAEPGRAVGRGGVSVNAPATGSLGFTGIEGAQTAAMGLSPSAHGSLSLGGPAGVTGAQATGTGVANAQAHGGSLDVSPQGIAGGRAEALGLSPSAVGSFDQAPSSRGFVSSDDLASSPGFGFVGSPELAGQTPAQSITGARTEAMGLAPSSIGSLGFASPASAQGARAEAPSVSTASHGSFGPGTSFGSMVDPSGGLDLASSIAAGRAQAIEDAVAKAQPAGFGPFGGMTGSARAVESMGPQSLDPAASVAAPSPARGAGLGFGPMGGGGWGAPAEMAEASPVGAGFMGSPELGFNKAQAAPAPASFDQISNTPAALQAVSLTPSSMTPSSFDVPTVNAPQQSIATVQAPEKATPASPTPETIVDTAIPAAAVQQSVAPQAAPQAQAPAQVAQQAPAAMFDPQRSTPSPVGMGFAMSPEVPSNKMGLPSSITGNLGFGSFEPTGIHGVDMGLSFRDQALASGMSSQEANYGAWDAFNSSPSAGYGPNVAQMSLAMAKANGMGGHSGGTVGSGIGGGPASF